jgi:23S rRNA (adenine2503-C2)-methyltransferase
MPQPLPPTIQSLDLTDIEGELAARNQPKYRASQVARWLYEKRATSFDAMSDLPAGLRADLSGAFTFARLENLRVLGSKDTTRKYLFRLPDGALIESVLIPASPALYGETSDRRTICMSTQVGCAYGCKFCASGLDGFARNLSPAEITGQFIEVERLSGERINNIVFMGASASAHAISP